MPSNNPALNKLEGILPVNKPAGVMSFSLITQLRRLTQVQKIGHTGTLDPFASGVMVLLIGAPYTKKSDHFLNQEKEYCATLCLGVQTDTYDKDGQVIARSAHIPSLQDVEAALFPFQGTFQQVPPMFSAKKIQGKKLYELARKGVTVERCPVWVTAQTTLLSYTYPFVQIHVRCSKGTYIRSIAHEMGLKLECGAHLCALERVRNGDFTLSDCCDGACLAEKDYDWHTYLKR